MLSDETFPDYDFDDLDNSRAPESLDTASSSNSGNYHSSTDVLVNSIQIQSLIRNPLIPDTILKKSFSSHNDIMDPVNEISYKSIEPIPENSRRLSLRAPPPAPMKKKRSQSCQDLNSATFNVVNRKRYDHIESKVKKYIAEMNGTSDQRTISRHKSMPTSSQNIPLNDEHIEDEVDIDVLRLELQKQSVKIDELKEKYDYTTTENYNLDVERAKMKLVVDSLRMELHELKEENKELKDKLSISGSISQKSSSSHGKNAAIQTDNSELTMNLSNISDNNNCHQIEENSVIRELIYSECFNNTEIIANTSNLPNQSINLSQLTNTSMDQLMGGDSTAIDVTDDRRRRGRKLKNPLSKLLCCVRK